MRYLPSLLPFLLALMLSAGLLFNIQPMVGKMLLPLVGGSPAVWNVAMAFFQISLLLGYLLAHVLSKVSPKLHGLAYLSVLAIAWLFLPIALPEGWQPDTSSYVAGQVLQVLFISISVPFIALSLGAPTLQRLFAAGQHESATDPYFLYAASNFGSFVGLLIYPFFFEQHYAVAEQARIWQYVFAVLFVFVLLCVFRSGNSLAAVNREASEHATIKWQTRGLWVLLAFIPSSLTLGVTTFISTDISPTPMLWVLTLGLYLLTYILAFANSGESVRSFNLRFYQVIGCLTLALYTIRVDAPFFMIFINLLALFVIALACHTLLSRARPAAANLTEFYFWLSFGGALGGSFNAFLAPLLFNDYLEYPLVLMLGLMVYLPTTIKKSSSVKRISTLIVLIGLVLILIQWRDAIYKQSVILAPGLIALIVTMTMLMLRTQRKLFVLALVGVFFGGSVAGFMQSPLYKERSFFGIVRVTDKDRTEDNISIRELAHGTTQHGVQTVRPTILTAPTAYYSVYSPIGGVFRVQQPNNVAVIGLGAGAINCYARQTDRFTFIEIDPLVIEAAQKYFTFLTDCPAPRIILGDGRLEMQKLSEKFDLLVIDAFSSDAIPVHLVTREAFAMYLSKLSDEGIIMVHVSNRFFQLGPMLAAIGADLGLQVYQGISNGRKIDKDIVHFPSEWVMLTRSKNWWEKLERDRPPMSAFDSNKLVMQTAESLAVETKWQAVEQTPQLRIWTDAYSNLLAVLK